MPAQKHPAYAEELEHCSYTLGYVEKSLEATTHKKTKVDGNLDSARRHFNAESSQSYIDITVNTLLQGSMDLKLQNLLKARGKPYFARIDFAEPERQPEKLYIGKMSLIRDEDQKLIIVDWRAPVANLYYEGRLGEASYDCPDGRIEGTLGLKRQFTIEDGTLKEIFDIDITTNDEFLQGFLGANADNRLKDIVSTIQAEQNAIVRADMWRPLIVQGAAGSGKTTIALHRIAYLIYNHEKTFVPENFMIVAPNKLFLNYISEVLPELGVEKVRQTTFEEFAMDLVGKKFKLTDPNEKLIGLLKTAATPREEKAQELSRRCAELKTSMNFRTLLDGYLKTIEESFIPQEDFKLVSKTIFTYKELQEFFLNQYKMWPIARRVDEIKKNLNTRIKQLKGSMTNRLHEESDVLVARYKATLPEGDERQQLITRAIDRRDRAIENLEAKSKQAVKDYVGKISKLSPFEYYKDLLLDASLFSRLAKAAWEAGAAGATGAGGTAGAAGTAGADSAAGAAGTTGADRAVGTTGAAGASGVAETDNFPDDELLQYVCEHTNSVIASGKLEIEDLAPIVYLKYCIYGIDEKIPVRHIVIDEAQDFSAFQIFVLKKIVKDSSFTIMGDLNQGIHSYRGIRDWNDITENVFSDKRNDFLTLEQSYRTTVEIMDAANNVIDKISGYKAIKARPVIRHGAKADILKMSTFEEITADISGKIAS
ncbi:MAG: AAA family ATPase, partial [Clostridiales bacterium]|nr:AAA family ATPase [Clostridiales bacterium]